MVMCLDKGTGGPGKINNYLKGNQCEVSSAEINRSVGSFAELGQDFVLYPNRTGYRTRSVSLPPFRPDGLSVLLGRGQEVDIDFSDSISLIEMQGGASISYVPKEDAMIKKRVSRSRS
ncbi:hypothetical protein A2U01_0054975, partial [Trifolium medium]|nr:hypothetical protein [Trifolium medium]